MKTFLILGVQSKLVKMDPQKMKIIIPMIEAHLNNTAAVASSLSAVGALFSSQALVIPEVMDDKRNIYMISNQITRYLHALDDPFRSTEFRAVFHMTQTAFLSFEKWILSHLEEKRGGWNERIEVMAFLRWLTSGGQLRLVGDSFDIPHSTMKDIIDKYLRVISEFAHEIISLPSHEELPDIAKGFMSFTRSKAFSRVAGALDGTLIRIKPPRNVKDKDHYYDRKKKHSINMQALVDDRMRFRYIYVGHPGRSHDSRVFKDSSLYKDGAFPPRPYYILGDRGYQNTLIPIALVSQFKKPVRGDLTAEQKLFNKYHGKHRSIIERAFGVLKNLFKVLENGIPGRDDLVRVRTIVACVVVYNFSISDGLSDLLQDLAFPMNIQQERETFLDSAFGDRRSYIEENDESNQECLRTSILEEMRRENLQELVEEQINTQESHGLPSQGSVFAAL